MKFVNFQKLKIKNFLSIGEEEVVIDFKKGLHIITGINRDKEDRRNGVGKSTIADALFFVIFGNTIRDIKKEYVPNNMTNGTCLVELTMNVNSPRGNDMFVITRTLNPSKLSVLKNGIDKTRDSIANTTEYIEAVISSTPELFHNCVIMTVNNTLPFMAKTKSEKRKFIEQIFNLQIFSDMISNLREDNNKISKSLDIEQTKFNELKTSLDMYARQKANKEKEKSNKVEIIKNKIIKNQADIASLEDNLKKIETINFAEKKDILDKLENAYKTVESKIENIISEVAEIKSDIKNKTVKHSNIGTESDICPTCLRPIEVNDRNIFEKQKIELYENITTQSKVLTEKNNSHTQLKGKLEALKQHISNVNEELLEFKTQIANKTFISKRISDLITLNKDLNDNLSLIEDNSTTFDNLINETNSRIDLVKVEMDNIKKVINLLEVVKFVVSEEGVKSFIVKKILQNFNSKLSYYLKKLDSNSICIFNEYFEDEILNEKGKICSYNNFSGAERKAIDLACLFSFMDMRKSQGNVHFNVSIYDELLDSSLDEKGVDIVLGLLKERSDKFNECIMIISHRKESIKSATGDVIFLEKYNGITKRINYVE